MDQCLLSDIKRSLCNKKTKAPRSHWILKMVWFKTRKDLNAYINIKLDSYDLESIQNQILNMTESTYFQFGRGIVMGVACD